MVKYLMLIAALSGISHCKLVVLLTAQASAGKVRTGYINGVTRAV